MNKFKYLKISNLIKIRYLKGKSNKKFHIVFLHGFMSDIEGEKPKTLIKYCNKNNLGFLAIEYSGHGKSTGKFTDGNVSLWTKQVKTAIKKIIKDKNFILIGSSMGSWLSFNQFKFFSKQIKGFIGIGSAPEFLEKVMWKKFTKKMKIQTIQKGIYNLKHGGFEYPITYQLIKDSRKNLVFNKKIYTRIPVSLFHGSKDEAIPPIFSRRLLKTFVNANKKLFVIKNGDHSLFKKRHQKIILRELDNIVKFVA